MFVDEERFGRDEVPRCRRAMEKGCWVLNLILFRVPTTPVKLMPN
jgi:hypothetical protein